MYCPVLEQELAKSTSGSAATRQEITIAKSLCVFTEMYSSPNRLVSTEGDLCSGGLTGRCVCNERSDWWRAAV